MRTLLLSCVVSVTAIASSQARSPEEIAGARSCTTPDRSEVRIPGGTFLMGSQEFYEEEGPVHRVTVAPFSIDRFDVTNAQFAQFVAATGYVTDAERKPDPKDYPDIPPDKLTSGAAVFAPRTDNKPPEEDMEWWQFVDSNPTAPAPEPRIQRITKGGSFMCSSNYCQRFRPAARQPQESGFSSMHLGFRTVSNRKPAP